MNFPELYQDAEQGDAEAQIRLGRCYKWGDGVEEDLVEAVRWYRKAAAQGNKSGQEGLEKINND